MANLRADGTGVGRLRPRWTLQAGLKLLDGLAERLAGHHRLHATRAHLLELAGDRAGAAEQYRIAAARTASVREQHYLTTRAARLNIRPRDLGEVAQ